MSSFTYDSGLWETTRRVPAFDSMLKVYVIRESGAPPTPRQREVFDSLDNLPENIGQDIAGHAMRYLHRCRAEANSVDIG
jgi:hypothetical protein